MMLEIKLCMAVFPFLSCHNNVLCKMPGNGLQPVAYTEDGDIEFEDPTQ